MIAYRDVCVYVRINVYVYISVRNLVCVCVMIGMVAMHVWWLLWLRGGVALSAVTPGNTDIDQGRIITLHTSTGFAAWCGYPWEKFDYFLKNWN